MERPVLSRTPFLVAVWIFLAAAFFLIKYYVPAIFQALFDAGHVELIQRLSGFHEEASFTTYWGYIHEDLFGPLEQVLSVIVLAGICWRYDKRISPWAFWVAVFAFLLVTKWSILFWPTYGEANAGHFVEALWLKNHDFNYALLAQQKHFGEGGPKAYLISIFPGLLAVSMKLIPNVKALLAILHTLVFAQSAAIIALLRMIVQKFSDSKTAILSPLIVLMLPLYQAQTEYINMEIPVVLCAVASLYFLLESRVLWAGLCAVAASLLKGPGGVACAAFFVYMMVLFLCDRKYQWKWRYVLAGAAVFAIGFSKRYLRFYLYPVQPKNSTIAFLAGLSTVWECRYLMAGLAVLCAGAVIIFIRGKLIQKKSLPELLQEHRAGIVLLIYAVFWYAFYVNLSVMGPRYKLLAVPFLIGGITYVMDYFLTSKRVFHAILGLALLAAAFGSYGKFFPKKYESAGYHFNALERSLEYRNDQRMIMQLAQEMQRKYADWTIVAPFPVAQMLAFPQFGFVDQDLDVVSYGMETFYEGPRNYPGLSHLNIKRTIFIGMKRMIDVPFSYPVGDRDLVINEVRVGNKRAVLFMGGSAIEHVYQAVKKQALMQSREKSVK